MIKYIKCFTLIILFTIKIVNAQSDDSYIRKGINDVLYTSSPEYIEKLYGAKNGPYLKKVALDNWRYIDQALSEILSWKYTQYIGVIKDKVIAYLTDIPPNVKYYDASRIGTGLTEYAKGDR